MPADQGFPVDQATSTRMIAEVSSKAQMVVTPELRFEAREAPHPTLATAPPIIIRILQQRWVRSGTRWEEALDDSNSEWRDVPCVPETR